MMSRTTGTSGRIARETPGRSQPHPLPLRAPRSSAAEPSLEPSVLDGAVRYVADRGDLVEVLVRSLVRLRARGAILRRRHGRFVDTAFPAHAHGPTQSLGFSAG